MGGGDVDLVEMRMFHTSASFSLQMNQTKNICFVLPPKTKKTSRKQKKHQKKQNSRHYMATPLAPCSLWSFFLFSRGFWHFGSKTKKTSRKQKKTLDTIWLPPWPHVVCGVFFSRSFFTIEECFLRRINYSLKNGLLRKSSVDTYKKSLPSLKTGHFRKDK